MAQPRILLTLPILFCLAAPAARSLEIPRKSPELAIGMPGGKQLLLSNYRGKVVVLAFILTTCPHCQRTTGLLNQLQTELGPRGLQVLESATEEGSAMNIAKFVTQFNTQFPVGFNTYAQCVDYLQHPPMLILHVPALVFIDRQGTIRAQYEGDDKFFAEEVQDKNIRDTIEKLLKEGSPATKKSAPAAKKTTTTAARKPS